MPRIVFGLVRCMDPLGMLDLDFANLLSRCSRGHVERVKVTKPFP
jgi:hypothetical protein